MKVVNIREARADLSELVAHAQGEPVCLTRHGKPVAVLKGVEGADLETVLLENSRVFAPDRRSQMMRSMVDVSGRLDACAARAKRAKLGGVSRRLREISLHFLTLSRETESPFIAPTDPIEVSSSARAPEMIKNLNACAAEAKRARKRGLAKEIENASNDLGRLYTTG